MNLQINDLIIKSGNPPSRWRVEQFLDFPGLPKHVRLKNEEAETNTVTLAVSALLHSKQFKLISGPV